MLTADQVRPFLCHADDFVRSRALDYFAEAATTSLLPAADIWSVVERFGPHNMVLLALRKATHTPTSTDRLIEYISQGRREIEPWVLEKLLAALPIEHLEMVATHPVAGLRISKKARLIVDGRRKLLTRSPSALWDELSVYAQRFEVQEQPKLVYDDGLLIVDAIAQQDGGAAAHVMDLIAAPKTAGSWLEVYFIDLAGRLQLEAAIPFLLDVIGEDGDLVNEHAARALGMIGTSALAAEIADRYTDSSETFQIYTPSGLASMRTNEAESALVRILGICRDNSERATAVADELCEIATTVALPTLLDMVEKGDFEPFMTPLDEHVLALSIMQGLEVPWEAACRQKLLEQRRRFASRQSALAERAWELSAADLARRTPKSDKRRVWVSSSKKRKGSSGKK